MQHTTRHRSLGALRAVPVATMLAVGGSLAACSGSDVAPGRQSQIGFTSSSSLAANATTVPVTSGGHTLDLAQVTLSVSRIELKRALTNACSDDDALHDDDGGDGDAHAGVEQCAELRVGPTTVDLPLSGGMVTLPADALPAGTFRELEMRLSQVELKGTFDGQAFDVTLPVGVHAEIELSTPLAVVEGSPTVITINVPVNDWLTNPDGSLVDPTTISSNSALLDAVRDRIRASLRAFEDEDHDGHDDHDGHGGNGDG